MCRHVLDLRTSLHVHEFWTFFHWPRGRRGRDIEGAFLSLLLSLPPFPQTGKCTIESLQLPEILSFPFRFMSGNQGTKWPPRASEGGVKSKWSLVFNPSFLNENTTEWAVPDHSWGRDSLSVSLHKVHYQGKWQLPYKWYNTVRNFALKKGTPAAIWGWISYKWVFVLTHRPLGTEEGWHDGPLVLAALTFI